MTHPLELAGGPGLKRTPRVWLPPNIVAWRTRDKSRPHVFDFSQRMLDLVDHIAATMPELNFIRTETLAVDVVAAKQNTRHGLQARLTPMRLEGGGLIRIHRGRKYQLQQYTLEGRRLLYIVTFCMPRYFRQTYPERLATLFHELLHISPDFDGDIRRFGGRYAIHSKSKDAFHQYADTLAEKYNASTPEPAAFLRMNHEELWHAYGGITALKLPRPKLILVG